MNSEENYSSDSRSCTLYCGLEKSDEPRIKSCFGSRQSGDLASVEMFLWSDQAKMAQRIICVWWSPNTAHQPENSTLTVKHDNIMFRVTLGLLVDSLTNNFLTQSLTLVDCL